jgi:hypothetical protein
MTCQCGSDRFININGKCSDLASMSIPSIDFEHDGYLPHLGIAPGIGGDYLELSICLDCGTVQEWEVKSDEELTGVLQDEGLIELDETLDDLD